MYGGVMHVDTVTSHHAMLFVAIGQLFAWLLFCEQEHLQQEQA